MHSNGYVPSPNIFRDMINRLIGMPNLMKRLQWQDIFYAIDVKKDELVLDFGCSASGYMTYELARRSKKAYGIDVSPVHELYVPESLAQNLTFLQASGEALPFNDGYFDVILMSEVLPMVSNPEHFISEAKRVLKKTGRIVLVNPLERKSIKEAYKRKYSFVSFLVFLGLAPKTYDDFTSMLQSSFGTSWKALRDEVYYEDLLSSFGFEIKKVIFSPSQLAQSLFETWQFFDLCLGFKTVGPKYFLLYPILKILDLIKSNPRGTGCIIVGSPQK